MAGLKYSGRKIPFIYEGENITCKKISWGERGQVQQVPLEDAELLASTSPTDFTIVPGISEEEPIETIEKEMEEEVVPSLEPEEEENSLACTHDECDFVAKSPHGLKMHTDRKHPKPITPVIDIKE